MPQKASIIDIIKQQLKKDDSLPVLNPKALKIQGEATKSDPDFNVLARMIRMDPTLTSQVLKTANSPFTEDWVMLKPSRMPWCDWGRIQWSILS